jgi:hypothetical protein
MDARYNQGEPLDHLIEECSELIKAICKFKRFGPQITDSFTGQKYNNALDVITEMEDVKTQIQIVYNSWNTKV